MRAGIALGSNIEPRLEHLQNARLRLLELHEGTIPARESQVYETAPVDCPPGSGAFLNAVMEIETALPPPLLLDRLQSLEETMGRPKDHARNSPRSIDLDILYYGDLVYGDARLTLPHPRLKERQFVLRPLADVQPHLLLPDFTETPEQLLKDCKSVEKIVLYRKSIS